MEVQPQTCPGIVILLFIQTLYIVFIKTGHLNKDVLGQFNKIIIIILSNVSYFSLIGYIVCIKYFKMINN